MLKNRKTLLAFVFCIVLASNTALAAYPEGTFIGKAKGHNGLIAVEVTVVDGKIATIEVVESEETPLISDTAFATVAKEILKSQKLDVDAVLGATISSRAMMNAVEDALKDPGFKDGTYQATAKGHNGFVKFEVKIKNNRVSEIKVLESEETPIISDTAFAEVSEAIVKNQEASVDAVLGATVSSKAMISAVNDVLSQAKAPEKVILKDGVFIGSAKGHNAPLKVEVSVKDGKLVSIKVLEHKETPGLGDVALEKTTAQILEKQTIDVDAVAGASVTSKALMEAVKDALK